MAPDNEAVEDSIDAEENVTAIIDASTFEDTLDAVGALVDECKIHLEEDGIAIRAVDPANVGMIDVKLGEQAFEAYNGDGGLIGVNLTRMKDIAGMADSGQLIKMDLDKETRKLNINIGGLAYNLALIDPDSIRQEPDIPDLDLPAEVVTEVEDLTRGIKAADMVSDHIELAVNANESVFKITAEGDTDDVDLNLTEEDLIDIVPGEASSLYSLDYLKDMQKAIPSKSEVTMELGEEFPVKLHFDYAEGAGNATFMLAPRIQSD